MSPEVDDYSTIVDHQIQQQGRFEFELGEGYSISTAQLYTPRAFSE
jgi:hypothetical protein